MKKIILILSILCSSLSVLGQQDAMYSQYMFNTLAINPAYAGSRNIMSATTLLRTQWVGIEGAPKTQTISFDMPLRNEKLGIGVQAFNYKMGITNLSGGFASFAYRIPMDNSTLAFGLQAGASHIKADLSSVNLGNPTPDQKFLKNMDQVFLNFGTGVYFNSERFYLGVSVPHLLKNTLNNNSLNISDGQLSLAQLHLFVTSGYVIDLGPDFKLKPSFLFKGIQGAPIQVDLNTNLWIKDVFSVGAQYRTGSAVAAMLEIQVTPQVRVGYSYDRSITKLAEFNSGSHEIMLRYELDFNRTRDLSPRYF